MTLPGLACDDEAPPGGAAGALERERRLNAALLDTVRALTVILDREGRIVRFNRACRHLTGLEEAEAVGRAFHDVLPMVDGEDTGGRLKGLLAGEEQPDTESTLIVKGGERRRISWTSAVLRDAAGAIEQVVCMGVDVTSQRQAQREVTEAVRRLEDAVDGMSESFCLYDADDRLVLFNRQFAEIYRDGRHIVRRGRRFEDVLRDLAAAGWFAGETDDVDELVEQRLRQHRAADGIPIRRQLPDGRWMQIREYATREGGIVGIATDITALVEQAKQLSDSERQLRLISDNLPAAIAYVDAGYRLRYVSRTGERWLGRPADELRGRHLAAVLSRRLFVLLKPSMERALAGEQVSAEHEPAGFDSPIRCIEAHYVPDRAEDGTVRGFYALLTDVTERRALQEQLHEAQKIEAIGQLTGGVAHDFNNLLGIIIGNLDLLLADLRQDPGASELLERAISSAERGASQTQKLLAFARRQSLLPRITDVGRLIGEAADLLKRTLGADIALQTRVADNLWPALVDPGQLEAALVNLVVNARDATPGGGRVVIDARNLHPGQQLDKRGDAPPASGYVIVSVSDNGIGMAPEVRERATEPFFSTKEGAGSGLGLSMAYGFCQQSGGYLDIDSSLGQGTTVSLYLPRAESRPEVPPLEAPGPGRTAARAGGARDGRVVLVVEDSDEMRRFSALAVTTLGYEVAEAADMEAALTALRQKPGISLLFTDILLGNGQNGLDLAKQARAIVPDIGVVMTSGFADHEAIRETVEALGARFLAKPFRVEDLARVLEEVAAASGVSRPVAV